MKSGLASTNMQTTKAWIPRSFSIMGHTITVEFDSAVHYCEDSLGWAKYREDKIVIQPPNKGVPLTEDQLMHGFFHELVHFVFFYAGEDGDDPPLHRRERLVERVAGLLHQAFKTMQWEGKEDAADSE